MSEEKKFRDFSHNCTLDQALRMGRREALAWVLELMNDSVLPLYGTRILGYKELYEAIEKEL